VLSSKEPRRSGESGGVLSSRELRRSQESREQRTSADSGARSSGDRSSGGWDEEAGETRGEGSVLHVHVSKPKDFRVAFTASPPETGPPTLRDHPMYHTLSKIVLGACSIPPTAIFQISESIVTLNIAGPFPE
jgi:hypothetical protein